MPNRVALAALILLVTCAPRSQPPVLAPLPAELATHPAVGLWRFHARRTLVSDVHPNIFADSGYLSIIPEVVTPGDVLPFLRLRAFLTGMPDERTAWTWTPLEMSDSIDLALMGGLEIRGLPQSDTLSATVYLLSDMCMECRLQYGVLRATRVAPRRQ